VGVIVALAPAGGRDSIGYAALKEATKLDWQRVIPTLVLAADRDSILPIGGIRDLYADIRAPKKMFVLENAGHMHFCDDADRIHELFRLMPGIGEVVPSATPTPPFSELCPADHGYDFTKALTLAHFDAFVKGRDHAKELLASGVAKLLAERGIAFEQI